MYDNFLKTNQLLHWLPHSGGLGETLIFHGPTHDIRFGEILTGENITTGSFMSPAMFLSEDQQELYGEPIVNGDPVWLFSGIIGADVELGRIYVIEEGPGF